MFMTNYEDFSTKKSDFYNKENFLTMMMMMNLLGITY